MQESVKAKRLKPKSKISQVLRTVPSDCGFHFFTSIGNYTGVTAHSIGEFAENLKTINIDSVKFHFERADFQKWIRNVLCDPELAERIGLIGTEFSDESLRKKLVEITETRLIELRNP